MVYFYFILWGFPLLSKNKKIIFGKNFVTLIFLSIDSIPPTLGIYELKTRATQCYTILCTTLDKKIFIICEIEFI